jgi:hypothetical protein
MRSSIIASLVAAAAIAYMPQSSAAPPAKASNISIERYDGKSVITDLGYGFSLNKESSLRREWFVVRDELSPVSLYGSAGVNVSFKSGDKYASGQYQYVVDYALEAKEPISAYEVRIHVLDAFGKIIRTLSATELVDFSQQQMRSHTGVWHIWSESEAAEAFASVAYVAQVRTASGRVYEADRTAVFDQVRKVAKRITESDLEPKRDPQPKP